MSIPECPVEANAERLKQALEQLHNTMEWCISRQVMVDLASGTYRSTLSECKVGDMFAKIASASPGKFLLQTTDDSDEAQRVVQFDVKMAEVALANATSNAASHGDPNEPISLFATVLEGTLCGNYSNTLILFHFFFSALAARRHSAQNRLGHSWC
jgi:hypothetical protein